MVRGTSCRLGKVRLGKYDTATVGLIMAPSRTTERTNRIISAHLTSPARFPGFCYTHGFPLMFFDIMKSLSIYLSLFIRKEIL
jgi:hypothetical protein